MNAGATTTVVVPLCATAIAFTLEGGSGGAANNNYTYGGFGAQVFGAIAVVPGDVLGFVAGGEGLSDGTAGTSLFGSGGTGFNGGGGGGAASALYMNGRLLAVGGGGGGGTLGISSLGPNPQINQTSNTQQGNATAAGLTRYITNIGGSTTISTSGGGGAGTVSLAGAGGIFTGQSSGFTNGLSGSGRTGANGVPAVAGGGSATTGGSGAGGGGYFGGGSGATGFLTSSGTTMIVPAGGGGGSNFVDASVPQSQYLTVQYAGPGRVLVTFFS